MRLTDLGTGESVRQEVLSGGGMAGEGNGGDGPLNEEFGAFTRERLERWHVPGIAVAVVDGEETWTQVGSFSLCSRCSLLRFKCYGVFTT